MTKPRASLCSAAPDAGSTTAPAPLIRPGGQIDPDALRASAPADGVLAAPLVGDAPRLVTFMITHDIQTRLDRYLAGRIGFMSRSQLRSLIDAGEVLVQGRVAKASTHLRQGDEIAARIPPPPPSTIQPEEIPLDVLFEDEHLIVVNKDAGIIVHPARSHLRGTMLNALAWRFQHVSSGGLSRVGAEFARPGVVHRLDRDTTGVIVFAKTDESHWKTAQQFQERTCSKRYLALVHGVPEPSASVIDAPIGPHPNKARGYREKQVVRHDALGKASLTVYRTLESYGSRFAMVEVDLKTGRTHQIRVHMTHAGYPLVGDDMYGGRPLVGEAGAPILARQGLHAAQLCIAHPITGEPLEFTAPAPADYLTAVASLRASNPTVGRPVPSPSWLSTALPV